MTLLVAVCVGRQAFLRTGEMMFLDPGVSEFPVKKPALCF
jgi:hypothetical protein